MPLPYLIISLKIFGAPVLFLAYILVQVFIKKKKWAAIKPDVMVTLFFFVVYVGLFFVFTR